MSTLRETLQAAMSGDEPAIEPVAAAPAVEAAQAPAGGESAVDHGEVDATSGARIRDASGKFVAKDGEAGQNTPIESAKPVEPEAQAASAEPIRVPPSLPAAVKAKYHTLDPDVREAIEKLEGSVQTAKAEWGKKGERLNRFDEILEPRREKFLLAGLDEFTAVKTLFAAQDLLERDPVQGLTYLARSYGVDLRNMAQQPSLPQGGQQMQGFEPGDPRLQQAQSQLDPRLMQALQPLLQQVSSLTERLDGQARMSEQQQVEAAQNEVAAFASDPANMYFENVKGRVGMLLRTEQAQTLQEAYDMAIWADPQIRPLLLQAQAQPTPRVDPQAAQRQKAQAAAKAAGSVVGAPGQAVEPPGKSRGSIRADLEAAAQGLI